MVPDPERHRHSRRTFSVPRGLAVVDGTGRSPDVQDDLVYGVPLSPHPESVLTPRGKVGRGVKGGGDSHDVPTRPARPSSLYMAL